MSRKRTYLLLFAVVFLALSALVFTRYLAYHETMIPEHGIPFADVLMRLFPVADVSVYIFSITYGSILLYIAFEFRTKYFAERLMIAYGVILLTRIVTLVLVPLKAPPELVYLQDPFLNNLIYPGEVTTDLFYSGHTGLLFLLLFITKRKLFLLLGCVLGVLLMVQRVHYSIDILAAIPFAFVTAKLVQGGMKRFIVDNN